MIRILITIGKLRNFFKKWEIGISRFRSISDCILIGFIVLISFLYIIIAGRRFFDFDEFQVIYASAAILRGKGIYIDNIEIHFPLANLLFCLPIYFCGFEATLLILARYIILALEWIMLFYAYHIGSLLWNRKTGLLSILLILTSVVFIDKGIEIRHDVFNALFGVIGVYYGLKYIHYKKYYHIVISALFLGMAIAITQKAIITVGAILIGFIIYLWIENRYKQLAKILLIYFVIIPIPLICSLIILLGIGNDTLDAFYQHAVKNVIFSYSPHTTDIYPFPYKKTTLFLKLVKSNPIFYIFGIWAIILVILSTRKEKSKKIIIAIWAGIGLTFYATSKRPFFQSLLPTIPVIAILVAGLMTTIWKRYSNIDSTKKFVIGILCIGLLFIPPLPHFLGKVQKDVRFERALINASFCVRNLKKEDKVLCFTQNQLFFDSILRMSNEECGKRIWEYDVDCFEKKMMEAECKVVINDYRTQLLHNKVKKVIDENYVYTKYGDIFIPGHTIQPNESIRKNIWIRGIYFCPTLSLWVDGNKIGNRLVFLEKGYHEFKNSTDRKVMLIHMFNQTAVTKLL